MKNGVIKKENSGNVRKICFSRAAANIGLFFALIAAAFSAAAQTPCTGSDREIDTDTGICVCIGQDRTMENEQCVCPSGTEEIPGSQNCATECTGEFSRQTGGACGCPAGQIPQTTEDNNLCVCPAGGKIKQGDSCVCPSGMEEYPASSNTCVAVCTDDFERQTDGSCGCPSGMEEYPDSSNMCVAVCEDDFERQTDGLCGCSPGMEEYPAGSKMCVAECMGDVERQSNGRCGCPSGMERVPGTNTCLAECEDDFIRQTDGSCDCPVDSTPTGENQCQCLAGTEKISTGDCRPECMPGLVRQSDDSCGCPDGMDSITSGETTRCLPPCPSDDFQRSVDGSCVCPQGIAAIESACLTCAERIPGSIRPPDPNSLHCICPAGLTRYSLVIGPNDSITLRGGRLRGFLEVCANFSRYNNAEECNRGGWRSEIQSSNIESSVDLVRLICSIPVEFAQSNFTPLSALSASPARQPLTTPGTAASGCVMIENPGFVRGTLEMLPRCDNPQLFGAAGLPQKPQGFSENTDRLTVAMVAGVARVYFANQEVNRVVLGGGGGDGISDKGKVAIGTAAAAVAVLWSYGTWWSGVPGVFSFTPR